MCGPDGEAPAVPYQTPRCLRPNPSAGPGEVVVESFPITYDGYTYKHGHIAYVKGRPPAPVVLVHHNYAGLKQFDIDQACFLAKVGYVGLATDLYKEVPEYKFEDRNPAKGSEKSVESKHFKGAFTQMQGLLLAPKHWRGLMKAFLDAAQSHPAVKPGLAAAIGYCLGGQCLLEQVRAGHKLQAVVSFHGLLQSRPFNVMFKKGMRRLTKEEFENQVDVAPNAYSSDCKVLIENGDSDGEVPQEAISEWKEEMNAQGIDWRFNNHARTPHGFALAPGVWSTEYTEAADRRSTLSMLSLFAEVWPEYPQYPVETNACGTYLGQHIVPTSKL
mmetsp:Transcript_102385/g.298521  ORF Transcript_102385/g.298521 Transcript_102385/m.298521 type:complete len:330 (+) Transcript_102385:59-1048(+)